MKLLFICSRNKWRSLTAEKIFHGVNDYDVRSAGTEENARIKVTSGHIGWADLIFVMEKKHIRRLNAKFGPMLAGKKVICLDIPDDYKYMDDELIEILYSRVSEYIELPFEPVTGDT
ncbi:low molecular weight protein tyrosine phosphatase family protein [Paenibacillus konkukensis]|uniref:low molecular weight protein tyrosine phosphatase family protein n=1 Tax=Paenibacillus konkukensis TaxID=2020716 RepID=UPI00201E18E4|nr:protein tyrosine phosphatase [Paenibacillus konkukensis]